VHSVGAQKNAQLIKGVEMLELHVIVCGTGIVIKGIKESVVFLVDADVIFVLV
jgi:hypothetical protein